MEDIRKGRLTHKMIKPQRKISSKARKPASCNFQLTTRDSSAKGACIGRICLQKFRRSVHHPEKKRFDVCLHSVHFRLLLSQPLLGVCEFGDQVLRGKCHSETASKVLLVLLVDRINSHEIEFCHVTEKHFGRAIRNGGLSTK